MSPPGDTRPVKEQIAELMGRVRAAHDARIIIHAVRAFWLEPQCHELGCPCHTPPAAPPPVAP